MQPLQYARFTKFILIVLTSSLCGCSFIKPLHPMPTQTYVLNPTITTITGAPSRHTVLVEVPRTSAALDTVQMVYTDQPYTLNYFSYNQWADSPAQMLQLPLAQALQNTGHFKAVLTSAGSTQYNLLLATRLLQLQQVFSAGATSSEVQLSLRAQLINAMTHQVLATRQFDITATARAATPYGGVIAANQAAAKLLQQVTQFCLDNTRHEAKN